MCFLPFSPFSIIFTIFSVFLQEILFDFSYFSCFINFSCNFPVSSLFFSSFNHFKSLCSHSSAILNRNAAINHTKPIQNLYHFKKPLKILIRCIRHEWHCKRRPSIVVVLFTALSTTIDSRLVARRSQLCANTDSNTVFIFSNSLAVTAPSWLCSRVWSE